MRSLRSPSPRLLAYLALASVWACKGGGDSSGPEPPPAEDTTPARVVVSPTADTLNWISATKQLSASVQNAKGSALSVTPSWTSSAAAVASVSASGLVTAVGVGTTTVTAQAGTVSGSATVVVRQLPATLTKISGDAQSGPVSQALAQPLVVEAKDQGNVAVPGAKLTWTASAGSLQASVETDASGRGQGSWTLGAQAGSQTVQVTAGPVSPVTFTATATAVTPSSVKVTSVEPTTLIEGKSATIRGSGFASTTSGNQVTVDGLAATVTSASSTELHIIVPVADCKPPRTGTVKVQVGPDSGSLSASVSPEYITSLDLGYIVYGVQCLHLAAGNGSERYVVGISSLSETPSSLTAAVLSSVAGDASAQAVVSSGRLAFEPGFLATPAPALPLAAAPSPELTEMLREHRLAEARWREAEWRELGPLLERARGSLSLSQLTQAPARAVSAGDSVTLNFPPEGGSCSTITPLKAVVRYVGSSAIWIEDVANPLQAFTVSELQSLDQFYTNNTKATITSYFGSDFDIDGNGRVVIFLTKEVNKRENLLGFVSPLDLFPRSDCARSNQAEIYYGIVPDPNGVVGEAVTRDYLLQTYPSLMPHEITHVIQLSQIIYGGAELKSTWELEGGATLAEQLVGFKVLGYSAGQDLGFTQWQAGSDWFLSWAVDMALYFGLGESGRIPYAPEQCSWMGTEDEGNTGPCENLRAVYGVPAMLLRMVLDRWGGTYPGGEAALMRRLTNDPQNSGLTNLAQATGQTKQLVHTLFAATLWGDGRLFNSLTSWNLYGIFSQFKADARLQPYTYSGATPQLSVSVRAGSSAYLEWTPPTLHAPTSFAIRTSGGGSLPTSMYIWVLRIQ